MVSLDKIREDLREVRYYYTRKELFDETFKSISTNVILEKVYRYNEAIRSAPVRLYDLYVCLYPFYQQDMKNGTLSREKAKEYLQELFLMLQTATRVSNRNFTRGGESHFCIGGYLPNGKDGFNDLSKLILESLTDLPTWIPQVTFRWTAKTPRGTLRYVMDMERKDPHKRIAFQNDEKRMKCYTEICGFPFEKAVGYTTVGCNEPAFLGAITGSTTKINFLRSTETLFHRKAEQIVRVETFEEFYQIFLKELFSDLELAYSYDDMYNSKRAKDINYGINIINYGLE